MVYLSARRACLMALLCIAIVVIFATFSRKNVLAGTVEHSFYLPSVLKRGTDVYPRDIRFIVKYPGFIKADASWEPPERELTVTLYDQEGKPLVSQKGLSPLHLVYMYTKEKHKKARILGNSFRFGVSQSPFKSINGKVTISTPGKKEIDTDYAPGTRGPFGTYIDEEEEEKDE